MKTFICNGYRPAQAEEMNEAARIFAQRQARRDYGRRGDVRTCQIGAYSQDGRLGEYSAFIGITSRYPDHNTTGHQIHFTVRAS